MNAGEKELGNDMAAEDDSREGQVCFMYHPLARARGGESVEVSGFVLAMRENAEDVEINAYVIRVGNCRVAFFLFVCSLSHFQERD